MTSDTDAPGQAQHEETRWSVTALAAARRGDRDACRYLFVRFGEELHADFVGRGVPPELAERRLRAQFAAIPYERDAEFDAWLARRTQASRDR